MVQNENTRQTPEVKIAFKLTPAAKTVNTLLTPDKYGYSGEGERQSTLQTVDAIRNFNTTASNVNTVLMEGGKEIAEQEYLNNKSDWGKFSEEHPFLSHLNPHIQHTFSRIDAENKIAPILGDLQAQVLRHPEMTGEEYQTLLTNTKQETYQAAKGVTYYDLEKSVIPKINQVEQQTSAQYYAANAKFKYQEINNAHIKDIGAAFRDTEGLSLKEKLTAIQAVNDKYNLDLNSQDVSNNVLSAFKTLMLEESENMSFNPGDFKGLVKELKANGKMITDINPTALATITDDTEGYLSRRYSVTRQQWEFERFKEQQKSDAISGQMMQEMVSADPSQYASILNKWKPQILSAGMGSSLGQLYGALSSFSGNAISMKFAHTDSLGTYNSLMKKQADGVLNPIEVIQAANGGLITQETAKQFITGLNVDASSKVLTKGITTNATLSSLSADISAFAGSNDLMLIKDDPATKSILDGYANQFKAEYPLLVQQCQATKSIDPLVKRRREIAQQAINEIKHNKPGTKLKTPTAFVNPIFDPRNWTNPLPGGRVTDTAADHVKRGSAPATDMAARKNSPVVTPHDGILKGFYKDPKSGVYALIDIGDGHLVTISHLNPASVNTYKRYIGKPVLKGTPIGIVGTSGRTMNVNPMNGIIHVVVKNNIGNRYDPQRFISTN